MKKYIIIVILTFITISCKAQIVSLKDAAISMKSIGVIPQNTNYLKDTDGSLNKFEGTWKGEYNGNYYEFKFTKRTKYGDNPMKDILIGRFRVKDSKGNIFYNTFDKPDEITGLRGINFQSDMKFYKFSYIEVRGNCGETGTLYIGFKDSNNSNLMTIKLISNADITVKGKCDDYTPLIPFEKTIKLIKQ